MDEQAFLTMLLNYSRFNESFISFAKQVAKERFGWSTERINYHIKKWEKARKNI